MGNHGMIRRRTALALPIAALARPRAPEAGMAFPRRRDGTGCGEARHGEAAERRRRT